MVSRKQKIKEKREQEAQDVQQVRMAVAIFAALIVIGLIAYVLVQSGVFEPAPKAFEAFTDATGTPQEICDEVTPVEGNGIDSQFTAAPEMALEDGVDYQAIFCTTQGAIYIDLYEDRTPITVNNLVFLAGQGFYNNSIFHRVLEGFMAQGGDPTGTGRGGPGYQFADEVFPDIAFDRPYLLAMANAGPATNGSQFFITFGPTPHLNMAHTIFGEVLSGQAVVDSLNRVDPQTPNPALEPSILLGVFIVTPEQVSQ